MMISDVSVFKTSGREAWNEPGPKFTDDLRTVLRQFRTYDNLMTYLKTKSYNHLLDVLRQLVSDSQDRPIVVRFILKYVIR